MSRPTTRAARVAVAGLLALALGLGPSTAPAVGAPGTEVAPQVKADYRFQGTLASSVGNVPALRGIRAAGNPANRFVGTRPNLAYRFADGNGLYLPNATQAIRRGTYTIAIRMRLFNTTDYARVVNFQGDEDTGLYVRDGDLVLYDLEQPDNNLIVANQWVNVVLTRTGATNRVRGFVNGAQQFNLADPAGFAVMSGSTLRFFRDNSNREESAGVVSRIRLWNTALTPQQVAGL